MICFQLSSIPRLEQRIACMKGKLEFIEQIADVKPVFVLILNCQIVLSNVVN